MSGNGEQLSKPSAKSADALDVEERDTISQDTSNTSEKSHAVKSRKRDGKEPAKNRKGQLLERDGKNRFLPGNKEGGRIPIAEGGKRNIATQLREQIEGHAEEIVETVAEKAKEGDMTAARLLLERVVASKKEVEQNVNVSGEIVNVSLGDIGAMAEALLGRADLVDAGRRVEETPELLETPRRSTG